jgi:hypothetical protein
LSNCGSDRDIETIAVSCFLAEKVDFLRVHNVEDHMHFLAVYKNFNSKDIMLKSRKAIGIMAATKEGIIGKGNVLPWHYPEELEHFRSTTDGHTIIMGRKTYEAIPQGIFSSRKAIIFSKNPKTSLMLSLEYLLNPWKNILMLFRV